MFKITHGATWMVIVLAVLALGCATSDSTKISKIKPESERDKQQEHMQEMLNPSPNQ